MNLEKGLKTPTMTELLAMNAGPGYYTQEPSLNANWAHQTSQHQASPQYQDIRRETPDPAANGRAIGQPQEERAIIAFQIVQGLQGNALDARLPVYKASAGQRRDPLQKGSQRNGQALHVLWPQ